MKPINLILLVFSFCFCVANVAAQLDITDGNTAPYNPDNLVKNVFLGSGVEVTGVQYSGDDRAVGFFSGGKSEIGLDRGVVLCTGRAESIDEVNLTGDDNGEPFSGVSPQDNDLLNIAGDIIDDVALYTIKFIPSADTLRFRYVFASEEYPQFICSRNDVFGFFISGPRPGGGMYNSTNIAIVPDPSDPTGLTFTNIPVSINTVNAGATDCPAQFPEYYNEVAPGAQYFQMNAYLDIFTAEAIVIPCEEYTIKLGVADAVDDILNSAVFLEAKSFGTGTLAVDLNSLSVDGSLAEGCGLGDLEFSLPQAVNDDFILDFELLNPSNSATPNVDYPAFPDEIVIPAGQSSVFVPLEAFLDNEVEGEEIIQFALQVDFCNRDTFTIVLRDDQLFDPILPPNQTICNGEELTIESELDPSFVLPPDPFFSATGLESLVPDEGVIRSKITVSGVIPVNLTPTVIESICIIGAEHRDLTDFDIFVVAPGGQILELTTDNGFKPNNFADVDSFVNTCFTPYATVNINNGENLAGPIFSDNERYTGEFLPEGVWSDLWDGKNPTNGDWELIVIDDQGGFDGTLFGWSIQFRSFYGLTYEWTSDPASDHCTNCKDIIVQPSQETEYTLKITDSYGCERSAKTLVTVDPSLMAPVATCGQITENSIQVLWDEVPDNMGYEVRIDEGPWTLLGGDNFTFTSLVSSSDFEIEVRAVGANCNSIATLVECRTLDCAPPGIMVDIIADVSCPGGSDGEILITASGVGPFIYEIDGLTNNSGEFINVPLGLSEIRVTDGTGCIGSASVTMPGPTDFTVNAGFQLSDPCNVVGSITGSVDVSGGSSPYSYNWSSGSVAKTATNLVPGQYTITITDDNGCDTIHILDIPQLERLDYTIVTTAPLCKDDQNGTASIVINSGNSPFTYEWEDGSSENSNSNLSAGSQLVTVTDALGCAEPRLFQVDEGAVLMATIAEMNVTCLGQSDGAATAMVDGGQAPYNFIWSGGTAMEEKVTDLEAGTYGLTISDANECVVDLTFTIDEPAGLSFDSSRVDNLCFGESNGIITVEDASSPNGNVNITWDDGGQGFIRNNLPDGRYCFTLTDGTTCDFSECITIRSPGEINVNETITGPSCENTTDGTILLEVEGGVSPFTYEWQGPSGALASDKDLSNLSSGEYFLTITDANSCLASRSFQVDPPNPILIDSSVFPISCNGESTGQIFFAASGGSPPFSYEWTGPAGFTASTNNIQDIFAGTYSVTYRDNVGCTESFTFEVIQPDFPVLANVSPTDSVCFGFTDGSLEVRPTGGATPYSVLWSNGSTELVNSDLGPGIYSVTVTDARNCTSVESSEVAEVGEILLTLDQTPSSCFQTEDGSAEIVSISYGNNAADLDNFQIAWNSNPDQFTLEASGLTGGLQYIATATDDFGCRGQAVITIETPDPVTAELINRDNVSCFNGSDGKIEIEGRGGNGSYEYLWDGNANASTSNIASGLRRGSFTVTITDENACVGISVFNIEEPRPLDLGFRKIEVSCFAGSDGRAEATVTGGTIPYEYQWSNGDTAVAIENVVSDWYELTVTDANGCNIIDSVLVFEPDDPISAGFDVREVTCYNGRDGRIEVVASGGSGFYRYSLDGNSFSSTSVFTNLIAGQYTVYVNDFKGCIDTFTEVLVLEPGEVLVDLGEDLVIPFGTSIELSPSIFNAQGQVSYEWRSANLDLLSCVNCLNPTFDGQKESSFELISTDSNGCQGSDFINIRLENFSPLFVPTAFTPNGDGENDLLEIFGRGIDVVNQFTIYNRWGELVYSIEDLELEGRYQGWDGSFKGSIAPAGLYYWFAEVEFQNGFIENFRGNTTLLR